MQLLRRTRLLLTLFVCSVAFTFETDAKEQSKQYIMSADDLNVYGRTSDDNPNNADRKYEEKHYRPQNDQRMHIARGTHNIAQTADYGTDADAQYILNEAQKIINKVKEMQNKIKDIPNSFQSTYGWVFSNLQSCLRKVNNEAQEKIVKQYKYSGNKKKKSKDKDKYKRKIQEDIGRLESCTFDFDLITALYKPTQAQTLLQPILLEVNKIEKQSDQLFEEAKKKKEQQSTKKKASQVEELFNDAAAKHKTIADTTKNVQKAMNKITALKHESYNEFYAIYYTHRKNSANKNAAITRFTKAVTSAVQEYNNVKNPLNLLKSEYQQLQQLITQLSQKIENLPDADTITITLVLDSAKKENAVNKFNEPQQKTVTETPKDNTETAQSLQKTLDAVSSVGNINAKAKEIIKSATDEADSTKKTEDNIKQQPIQMQIKNKKRETASSSLTNTVTPSGVEKTGTASSSFLSKSVTASNVKKTGTASSSFFTKSVTASNVEKTGTASLPVTNTVTAAADLTVNVIAFSAKPEKTINAVQTKQAKEVLLSQSVTATIDGGIVFNTTKNVTKRTTDVNALETQKEELEIKIRAAQSKGTETDKATVDNKNNETANTDAAVIGIPYAVWLAVAFAFLVDAVR